MLELDYESLMDVISNIDSHLEDYNTHITDMKTLSDMINSSSDWIDEAIKPSFISYLNSYIEIYKAVLESLESYAKFLRDKAENFNENEGKFS